MKWFRSNVRLGSRLALVALAVQFLLSFGHFHSDGARASPANATRSRLHASLAATHLDGWNRASDEHASGLLASKNPSDHEHDGQPADHCAICAVMALANAMVAATPPHLAAPYATAFLCLTKDPEFVGPNSVRIAFQPRAPPIS